MPPANFHPLTRAQFDELLGRFPFQRKIVEVHMHHTFIPTHADYRGLQTIVDMWKFHTQTQGWSDIAQHVSIAPDGTIWTGRDWNRAPASAKGFNGSSAAGPFMFETIGNFDVGHDVLEGEQLESVVSVIALVQECFDLPVEALRFHNQMTDEKTCPGTGVRKSDILQRVADFRAKRKAPRTGARGTPPLRIPTDPRVADALVAIVDRRSARSPLAGAEEELHEGGMTLDERRAARGDDAGARAIARGGLTPAELVALQPHVVNLNHGELSSGGAVQTTTADIDAIFGEHIPKFFDHPDRRDRAARDIVFFAHGGLVGELSGLGVAHKGVEWWKSNNVYPVYFVWETGLCESLAQILHKAQSQVGGAGGQRGIFDPLKNLAHKIGDFVVDHITDNVLAEVCHDIGGVSVWDVMKSGGRTASAPGGGGRAVADRLSQFLTAQGEMADRYRLHAVGHSAGSIFHSHFVPLVQDLTNRTFATVQFLAPAIRVDEFKRTLWPLVRSKAGGDPRVAAERLTIYTMRDALERADNCGPYRKSLLYLIHDGLEPRRDEPILGLERSMQEDGELARDLLSAATRTREVSVVFSPSPPDAPDDARTMSDSHGGFDDDPNTMDSVVRRVLAKPDGEITHFKTRNEDGGSIFTNFKNCIGDLTKTRDVDLALPQPPLPCGCGAHSPSGSALVLAADASTTTARGRRRALCIGIDRYPTAPLAGCVNDARNWATALTHLGFSARLLIEPSETTRSGILAAIGDLIGGAQAGDVLVLQYSGHGTELPDRNHDETEDAFDQAVCPIDFASGHFLVDDDVAVLFAKLPAGVNLTCFFDCCHSGSITRFAVGDPQSPSGIRDRRARFIKPTPEMIAAHEAFRARIAGSAGRTARAFSASRGPAGMREVVFSACRRDEVAFENDGQGDFTRRAIPLLDRSLRGTNADFRRAVIAAFGPAPSQHPLLDCSPASETQSFLGGSATPARGMASAVTPSFTESLGVVPGAANAPLARLLRDIADLIDHG